MVGPNVFKYMHGSWQHINTNKMDFGGVSILSFGSVCHLPPVKQKTLPCKYENTWIRFDSFKKKKIEIMKQNDDLHFAHFLNRIKLLKLGANIFQNDETFLEIVAEKSSPSNVMRAYEFNKDVDHYNVLTVNEYAVQSKVTLHEIYVEHYAKDKKCKTWDRLIPNVCS